MEIIFEFCNDIVNLNFVVTVLVLLHEGYAIKYSNLYLLDLVILTKRKLVMYVCLFIINKVFLHRKTSLCPKVFLLANFFITFS